MTVKEAGQYYGYPECCIEWFITRALTFPGMPPLTPAQAAAHGGRGFVPCPECAEKVTAETIHTLIKERQCIHPYPKDDDDVEFERKLIGLVSLIKTMHSSKVYIGLQEKEEATPFVDVMKSMVDAIAAEIRANYGEKEIMYAIVKAREETREL
jgi:hypothetical protein